MPKSPRVGGIAAVYCGIASVYGGVDVILGSILAQRVRLGDAIAACAAISSSMVAIKRASLVCMGEAPLPLMTVGSASINGRVRMAFGRGLLATIVLFSPVILPFNALLDAGHFRL
jgi:hypothetical protein